MQQDKPVILDRAYEKTIKEELYWKAFEYVSLIFHFSKETLHRLVDNWCNRLKGKD